MENQNVKVNDGGGFYDTPGFIDSIIVDCNDLVKRLLEGNYIGFCSKSVEIVQKLTRLKEGVKAEQESKDAIIQDLKRLNNDLAEKATGIPADREDEKGESNV